MCRTSSWPYADKVAVVVPQAAVCSFAAMAAVMSWEVTPGAVFD